jgi:transcriptional regulator with XRE-family HTH domain
MGYQKHPPGRVEARRALSLALKEFRRRAGLSQEALALESGVDRTHVGLIERELRSPTVETLLRLLAPLGATFTMLGREFDRQLRLNARK